MSDRVEHFTATIPAGTLQSSPTTIDLELDNWQVEAITLKVPAGPSGLMGFYVANNGVQWVPKTAGSWLVWNDHSQTFYLTRQPNASGWQIVGYNTGTYDHDIFAAFHVTQPKMQPASIPELTFITRDLPEPTKVIV